MKATFEHYRVVSREGLPTKGATFTAHRYSKKVVHPPWDEQVPYTKGGLTVCTLYVDGKAIATGTAICSMSDNFSYKIGRRISRGRALKQAEINIRLPGLYELNKDTEKATIKVLTSREYVDAVERDWDGYADE